MRIRWTDRAYENSMKLPQLDQDCRTAIRYPTLQLNARVTTGTLAPSEDA
jgi:hypothetical protein